MKIDHKRLCSRCGEEILPSELTNLEQPICALCEHIQLEAKAIFNGKNNPPPPFIDNLYKFNR